MAISYPWISGARNCLSWPHVIHLKWQLLTTYWPLLEIEAVIGPKHVTLFSADNHYVLSHEIGTPPSSAWPPRIPLQNGNGIYRIEPNLCLLACPWHITGEATGREVDLSCPKSLARCQGWRRSPPLDLLATLGVPLGSTE